MSTKISLLAIVILLTTLSVSLAYAAQIPPSNSKETMTCYDHSIEYAKKHPGWGCVTISTNPLFKGISHMVNYQLLGNGGLHIHDETCSSDYITYEWYYSGYWHFWINENPVRNYMFLRDNSQLVILA